MEIEKLFLEGSMVSEGHDVKFALGIDKQCFGQLSGLASCLVCLAI